MGLFGAERFAIAAWIAANLEAGNIIEGTGGARKLRFAGKGKGREVGEANMPGRHEVTLR